MEESLPRVVMTLERFFNLGLLPRRAEKSTRSCPLLKKDSRPAHRFFTYDLLNVVDWR